MLIRSIVAVFLVMTQKEERVLANSRHIQILVSVAEIM